MPPEKRICSFFVLHLPKGFSLYLYKPTEVDCPIFLHGICKWGLLYCFYVTRRRDHLNIPTRSVIRLNLKIQHEPQRSSANISLALVEDVCSIFLLVCKRSLLCISTGLIEEVNSVFVKYWPKRSTQFLHGSQKRFAKYLHGTSKRGLFNISTGRTAFVNEFSLYSAMLVVHICTVHISIRTYFDFGSAF